MDIKQDASPYPSRIGNYRFARLPAAFLVFSGVWFLFAYVVATRVPPGVASWLSTFLYSGWSFVMAGLCVVAVVRRRTRQSIWLPLTGGIVLLVTGDLLWDLSAHGVIPTPNDTPSVMDAFYLPAYAAIGVTAVRLVRRYHGRGVGAVLDTLIVTAGVVTGVFPLVIRPYEDAIGVGSLFSQALHVAYPICDLLLVAGLAAGAFSGFRMRPLRVLGAAAACCLIADHVYLIQTQRDTYVETGSWVDWLWLAEYTLMAAAVTAPLPEPSEQPSDLDLARRVAVLVGSAVLCPVLFLVVQLGFIDEFGRPATDISFAVSSLVLVGLVCARLAHLLIENARTVGELRTALAAAERLGTDLDHQALHDWVTGLPNRRQLNERMRVMAGSGPHAVVSIDLDDFTAVNDDFGHVAGDQLLREVATRLLSAARPGDLVARLGGDEFAVLLVGSTEPEAVELSRRMLEMVSAPIVLAGLRTITLGASAGVAVISPKPIPRPEASEVSELSEVKEVDGLVRADVAMYAAKRAGHNRVLAYTDEMRAQLLGGSGLAGDLVMAVRDGSLDVVYQPITDLASNQVVALEALVRWQHPVLGLLPPLRFLPLAVERGVIADLDLLVLERGLAHVRGWRELSPGLRVGFNASAELLAHDDVVEVVLGALARRGLPGEALTMEVTEQSVIDDSTGTAQRLQRLRDAGVSISLDDFGTGYSSLSYLEELPVDVLKLDRSFVTRGISGGAEARADGGVSGGAAAGVSGGADGAVGGAQVSALVRTVVELGHELGLRVLAEGIETAEQNDALLRVGCDLGQGWLFSVALTAESVGTALRGSSAALTSQGV